MHPRIDASPHQQLPQRCAGETAAERRDAVGAGHGIEAKRVAGEPEPCLRRPGPAQIGNHYPDARHPVTFAKNGDTGISIEVVRYLAEDHDIHAAITQGKRPSTSYRRLKAGIQRQPCRDGMPL